MLKKNIIHNTKFYLRAQEEEEPIEKFIRGLYELAEKCDFLKKYDQIRDSYWTKKWEKLQLRENLSLEKL